MPDLSNRGRKRSNEHVYKAALESLLGFTHVRAMCEVDPLLRAAYDLILSENSRDSVITTRSKPSAILRDRRHSFN